MVNLLLDVSAFDGRTHHEPGVIQVADYAFAARVVAQGGGSVLVVSEPEDGEPQAAEADLAQTLEALQVRPDADQAKAIFGGMQKRAARLAKREQKAAG